MTTYQIEATIRFISPVPLFDDDLRPEEVRDYIETAIEDDTMEVSVLRVHQEAVKTT